MILLLIQLLLSTHVNVAYFSSCTSYNEAVCLKMRIFYCGLLKQT